LITIKNERDKKINEGAIMKLYHNVHIPFLLFFMCTTARSPRRVQQQKIDTPAQTSSRKQAIIFDMTNVLFKENQIGFAKKVGYGTLASYTLTHWKSPGYRCLDMLAAMSKQESQKPHVIITLKQRTLPRCIVELYEGKKNCSQVRTEISHGIDQLNTDHFFSSAKEKQLMQNIMHLILDPQVITTVTEPIKHTIQLVQKLKNAGHPLYIFTNLPDEFYASLQKSHPDILQLFDGIVISSHVKSVKPDNAIFNHLLTTYKLIPQECILIDDLEANVAAAQKLGMRGIVCDKLSHVTNTLKNYGVKI
jgi:HAD superfamily hydrolase (TIGR01509 family)